MNVETKSNRARLQRIQTVSRIFRYIVLANLVFNVGFQLVFFSPLKEVTIRGLLLVVSILLMYVWFWKLAQLFRLYERGLIFAAETIRCIKVLGMICVAGWLVMTAVHFVPHPEPVPDHPSAGVTVAKGPTYRMGFLSFNFGTGTDFGFLFIGTAVILAAWIMDEGRKIQEEQELTV